MQLQLPQLWLLDLRPLMQDERWRAFLPELPIERQTRARSCRREEDAARLTGAGFLLQQALLSLNIPVSEQIFRKNDWGKPYLASHAVEFSLTHASYYAACALDASSGDETDDDAFPTTSESGTSVDLGVGAYYSHLKFYAAFSAHHLTAPRVSLGEKSQIKIHPIFYLTGGYNIQTRNPLISIQPSIQLQSDFTSTRLDVTGQLFYSYRSKVLSGGLTYSPDTSVTFNIGLTVQGVTLGYAYECFTSKIGAASGSHDLVVRYALDLNVFKKNRNLHKSVRIL